MPVVSSVPPLPNDDQQWMQIALQAAQQGAEKGEVPVGAVVVRHGELIACAHNQPITDCNPIAHAEMLALQQAAKAINNYRLTACDLYVTLEPCTMCAGAMVHSRLRRLIYGAQEPKAGAIVSTAKVLAQPQMNHRIRVTGGVLAAACGVMLSRFFQHQRQQRQHC